MITRKIKFIALLGALALGGCDPDTYLAPSQKVAICDALLGPIYYNTYNSKSGRYSGHILALDLKQRNQIWDGLGCKVSKGG